LDQSLSRGDQLRSVPGGATVVVEKLLGSGTQGEVYRATFDGRPVAVKWYFTESATPDQWTALTALVERRAPSSRFLWPIELVRASKSHAEQFGYVMELRPPEFHGISALLSRSVSSRLRSLATAGMQLADCFLQLHSRGLCYRDISQGNVFFNPATGDVLVCDNDNVDVEGQTKGVIGTPRYMAPEVVRGEAMPSIETDLFSLAVLLFLMLMNSHPLDGEQEYKIHAMDLPAMQKLYGYSPVFVFDPKNESNRPVKGYHDNALVFWPIYPSFVRDLFTRSFTAGVHDPSHGRVRETEWRETMGRLRDSIVFCGRCGRENFAAEGEAPTCWGCKQPVTVPARLRLGKRTIMLSHQARLYPYHLDEPGHEFTKPIAEVTQHPSQPGIWGLKNLSNAKWSSTAVGREVREVEPGRSATLTSGLRINFGRMEGEIQV
jgi:eukaryotic-like serine/threonine-protein kinase